MSVGRISGPLLKDNLSRNGNNLAFETDLLYLLVSDTTNSSNHFVGIKNQNPAYPLDITGTARATTLLGTTINAGNLQLNGNTLSSTSGALGLAASNNNNLTLTTTGTGKVIINGVVFGAGDPTIWYVSDNVGVDTNVGHSEMNALRTVAYALSQATAGDVVYILAGQYQEVFPLVVPKGVTVRGAGLRATTIYPTVGTNTKDCFLLNGETQISDLTIRDMFYSAGNGTGYAFRFIGNSLSASTTYTSITGTGVNASGTFTNVPQKSTSGNGAGASFTITKTTGTTYNTTISVALGSNTGANYALTNTVTISGAYLGGVDVTNDLTFTISTAIATTGTQITTRSPYVERVTILNRGSGANTTTDPYGFVSADAGRGAYIDGALVTKGTIATGGSLEAAMLFNEATFIVPNSRGLIMTNGARTEWLTCFTYFADLHVEALVGATGRGGAGQTYVTLTGKTGTYNIGDTLTLYSVFPAVAGSGVIAAVSGSKITLTGNVANLKTNANRDNKVVNMGGNARLSNAITAKFGATSAFFDGTGDYVTINTSPDFAFGTGDFEVDLWIYNTATSASNQILVDFRTTDPQLVPTLFLSPTTNFLRFSTNGTQHIQSDSAIGLNSWIHIAIARVSGVTRMFVGGVLQTQTYTDTNNYVQGTVTIGSRFDSTALFAGYIDEFRISKGVGRYTTTFTPATSAYVGDALTVALLHFDGVNNATTTTDDGITIQDIRVTSGGTATGITRYDTSEFGAEMRSISSANIYGNQGVKADGYGTSVQLMAHNFAYIGTGADLTNDKSAVVQANEVIQVNNGRVYYNSVDQSGNFRVGNLFTVNYETGAVNFASGALNLSSLNNITFNNGTNVTTIGPTGLIANNIIISGNTISSTVGPINMDPATGEPVTINAPTSVNGLLTTNSATGISVGTPALGTLTGAVTMTTGTNVTDGIAQLNQVLTLLTPAAPTAFPGASTLTVTGPTTRIMNVAAGSQVLNGTGITAPAAGTVVHVSRVATASTNTIASTGPGTTGTITVRRNTVAAVTKTLTYGNSTQVITASITGTTLNSNIVTFTPPAVGVLVTGYLITTGASGAFGGLANSTAYIITAVTATTLALSLYNTTTGATGAAFNGTSTITGTLTFSSSNDNGTYTANNTSLTVANNVASPVGTPGFYETVDLSVSSIASVPAGWNTVQIVHSAAGSTTIGATTTNNGIWYYDNSTTVAPTFGSQTFAIGTSSTTFSSTIPHYNSSTTFNAGFVLTWNAGQTGHTSTASNIITTAAVGPFTSAGNETYTALGYTTLPATATVTAGVGPNASSFTNNIITGFGAWTTTTTVPVYTADNSYTTANSALPALNAIILYKTGTTSSTTFLDETNIFFNSAVGGSSAGALRCVNPDVGTANQDTPVFNAGSAAFNSQTGTFYATDATVVGTGTGVNSLRHDVTNYSTGYLPAGPNLSGRTVGNAQYFTFRFVRTGVSKFNITYVTTTGVAKIYCAMPGTGGISGTTSTLNKWLDLSIDNSLANGCALGGNQNSGATGTLSYNCSFGTLSSSNSTNNEIWVRIRLNSGQSITGLYLGASTV
jgi:hypothetical protein